MDVILGFIILILSIIVHEVAHGYAADALGDPTARLSGRLTLNPLPHIDPVGSILIPGLLLLTNSPIFFGWAKPVPYNPYNLRNQRWGEALVGVAGVATNLFLAVLFGLMVREHAVLGLGAVATAVAATISFVNLFLGLFNLIPIPPLDGFTTLRALLPWHASRRLQGAALAVQQGGTMSLILFLIVFSYLFAGPFYSLVQFLFAVITGGA